MPEICFPSETDRLDHADLAADPRVKPWVDEAGLRSENTASVQLRRLGIFLWSTRLTTAKLLSLANEKPDELRNLLIAYAKAAKEAKYLGTYVRRILVSVRSFLRFNGSKFDQFPSVSAPAGESLVEERVPTPDEIRLLLTGLSARGKSVALFLAHAGLRPGVLAAGEGKGTDGLTIGDLPELRLEATSVRFEELPFLVVVPARLSKNGKSYLTFGSSELAEALVVYLSERVSKGEKLGKASPVIASTGQGRGSSEKVGKFLKPPGEFVSEKAIAADLRDAIRKVRPGGQVFRPYTLRAFCSTQLLLAEAHGKIVRDAREFFLGHDLGAAGRYHLGKKLHPDVIEELRDMYERASEYLSTAPKRTDRPDEIQREAAVLLLTSFKGKTEAEARQMVEGKTGDELATLLRAGDRRERVVRADDAPKLIEAGWTLAGSLKNGEMAVLRAPFGETGCEAWPLPNDRRPEPGPS